MLIGVDKIMTELGVNDPGLDHQRRYLKGGLVTLDLYRHIAYAFGLLPMHALWHWQSHNKSLSRTHTYVHMDV